MLAKKLAKRITGTSGLSTWSPLATAFNSKTGEKLGIRFLEKQTVSNSPLFYLEYFMKFGSFDIWKYNL